MHNYIILTIYNLDTTFGVMEGQVRGPGVCSAPQLLAGSYLRAGSPLGCFLPVILDVCIQIFGIILCMQCCCACLALEGGTRKVRCYLRSCFSALSQML